MTQLYDKECNLVGWLQHQDHIFDLNMEWAAYIINNNIWSVKKSKWIGTLYGSNVRDTNGKTLFWSPYCHIINAAKPLIPLKPLLPLRPFRPMKPLNPQKPLKPLTPLGGWSDKTWIQYLQMDILEPI